MSAIEMNSVLSYIQLYRFIAINFNMNSLSLYTKTSNETSCTKNWLLICSYSNSPRAKFEYLSENVVTNSL